MLAVMSKGERVWMETEAGLQDFRTSGLVATEGKWGCKCQKMAGKTCYYGQGLSQVNCIHRPQHIRCGRYRLEACCVDR